MQAVLIESAVRATLIAAAVALVLYAMRIKTASARHAVWASVVVVMLLLPAWLAWGPKALLPVLPRAAVQPAMTMPVVASPVSAPVEIHSVPAAAQPTTRDSEILLLCVYLLGVFVLLTRLAIGTMRTSRLTSASCIVPVTVGFLRPKILLPECLSEWPQARLDAVLIHEREHARRRDPLFQWIALLNRALFWFHPLAWWLERQLSGLAEEACDAAVLAQGHDPHDYSETLLDLSRLVELAGRRFNVGMAMPGTFLPQRIRQMLTGAPIPSISRPRMACTATVCAAAAALLAAGTLVRAQSRSQPALTFEVASVRPYKPTVSGPGKQQGGGAGGRTLRQFDHGRFIYVASVFDFILRAYGIRDCGMGIYDRARCPQLSGGPAWLDDIFEIQANTPDGTPDYTYIQFMTGQAPQLQSMLQTLLADRFNLKLRREKKQLAVYALIVGKSGTKLRKAEAPEQPAGMVAQADAPGQPPSPTVKLSAKHISMQELADELSNILGRPVLDRTALKGEFAFTMEYDRDLDPPETAMPAAGLGGPGLLSAFEKQLGLKLESTKAPVEVLVIDHAEQPSPN